MMLPFKLIKGNTEDLSNFESEISEALMQGYEISGDLVVTKTGDNSAMLLQPMLFDESIEMDMDDEEEMEEMEEIEQEMA